MEYAMLIFAIGFLVTAILLGVMRAKPCCDHGCKPLLTMPDYPELWQADVTRPNARDYRNRAERAEAYADDLLNGRVHPVIEINRI